MKDNKASILFCLTLFFIAGAVYVGKKNSKNSTVQKNPANIIVGTWDGIGNNAKGTVWTFKADGRMKEETDSEYESYELVKGATHTQCPEIGMTASSGVYDSDQLVLVIKPSGAPNLCYSVSYLGHDQDLNATLLNLWSASNGRHFAFEKRK